MTYPTIRSASVNDIDSTTLAYPASVVALDTLIFINIATTAFTPSGWTLVSSTDVGSAYINISYKRANGTEGGTSETTASSSSRVVIAVDAGLGVPTATATVTSSVDAPDPPSHSPALGSGEYLWLVWGRGSFFTGNAVAPTDFTLYSSGLTRPAVAYRNYTGSVLDPDAFGDGDVTNGTMFSATIAIPYVPIGNNLFFGGNF